MEGRMVQRISGKRDFQSAYANSKKVLQKIMTYFSNSELLQLSLVSKSWNAEARNLLRARGNTVARIGGRLSWSPSKDLVAFAKTLRGMTGIPFFAGIHVQAYHGRRIVSPCEDLDESAIKLIRAKLAMKYLQITFSSPFHEWGPSDDCSDWTERCRLRFWKFSAWLRQRSGSRACCCSTSRLLAGFLNQNFHELTEISLQLWSRDTINHLQLQSERGWKFPRLKILTLERNRYQCEVPSEVVQSIKKIVEAAPHLEQLILLANCGGHYGWGWTQPVVWLRPVAGIVDVVLQRSQAVVVPWSFTYVLTKELISFPQSCSNRMAVRKFCKTLFLQPRHYEMEMTVLRNSTRILEFAELDYISLAWLLTVGTSLVNLSDIRVCINFDFLRREFPCLLDSLLCVEAWNRYFPSLEYLVFCNTDKKTDMPNKMVTRLLNSKAGFLSVENDQGYSLSVKGLSITSFGNRADDGVGPGPEDCIFFCSSFCPTLTCMRVDCWFPSLSKLWSKCQFLQRLELELKAFICMDSIFCGISREEVEDLKRKDANYLKSVHIVPSDTPITFLKSLKSLVIKIRGNHTCVFSELSALICFSRMPGLTINVSAGSVETARRYFCTMERIPDATLRGSLRYVPSFRVEIPRQRHENASDSSAVVTNYRKMPRRDWRNFAD